MVVDLARSATMVSLMQNAKVFRTLNATMARNQTPGALMAIGTARAERFSCEGQNRLVHLFFSLHAPDVVVQQRQPGSKYCSENICVVRILFYGVLDMVVSSMVQAFYVNFHAI